MERPFGKYTLLKRLGGGGMAEVFRARLRGPEGFEKQLALKLILEHFSDEPEFVKMFIREATLAARLDHANIVRIHEFDKIEDRYYIAMELVNGSDLRKILARAREMDRGLRVPEALVIALEVARGLAFAHGELTQDVGEIVHRDISPHNIIVSRAGEVKITDFGIAKLASSAPVTKTGMIKGKAAYMSPEQARAGPVDRKSDLFSLGCVIWEMLTGQRLFAGDNDIAVLRSLLRTDVVAPSRHNPDVSADLDALTLRLLERDPARRLGSAADLGRELDRLLRDDPGTERTTLLADLVQDLFPVPPPGTAVLEAPPERGTLPQGGFDIVEPVGPDVPTRPDRDAPTGPAAVVPGRSRTGLILAAGALAALVMLALFLGPHLWSEPDDAPPSSGLPDGTPSPAGRPAKPRALVVEPVPSGGGKPAPTPVPTKVAAPSGAEVKRTKTRPGRLDLNAIPWAKVYWRKRLLGETPLEGTPLPSGKHSLLLVNPELEVRRHVQVHIRANRVTQRVVDLREK